MTDNRRDAEKSRPAAGGRKRVRGLIQIAISALLLALILRQVHWGEVREALAQINLRWLGLAWGLFLMGMIVRATRWQTLLVALGVRRPWRELVTWYFVGGFFNVILPTGFGGDAVRVAELAQDAGRPTAVLNSVVVDRYLGIMVLLPMGLTAALLTPGVAPMGVTALTAVLFGGGLLAAWLLRQPCWARHDHRAGRWGRIIHTLRLPTLADAIAPYHRGTLGRGLALSLVFNLLQIGWNIAIGCGLGLTLPLTAYLAFIPLTAVALLLPAFGGLGVRELTYTGLFASAGVPQPTALALSLGVYIITVATGVVGGVMYLMAGLQRTSGRHP